MDLMNEQAKDQVASVPLFQNTKDHIFSNFNGTDHDITVLTHEAGHAFQNYSSTHLPVNIIGLPWGLLKFIQ